MIPFDYITEWRAQAPWVDDAQVEQDLVISRALVEIFRHPLLAESVALRGGTALSKLHLRPPARYSEDIDLVQATAEPAGPMMDALRAGLEPWLGKAKWKQGEGRITFYFRFTAESSPVPLRLKVEMNTREHFAIYGLRKAPFAVSSRWFEGACDIQTYELDELLGTKFARLKSRSVANLSQGWRSQCRKICALLGVLRGYVRFKEWPANSAAVRPQSPTSCEVGPRHPATPLLAGRAPYTQERFLLLRSCGLRLRPPR